MLGRFKRATAPTILLWLYALAYGIIWGITRGDARIPSNAELVSSIALPFLITYWVTTDARIRRRVVCYDFDAFVFFGWPVIAPVYLFQTRGIRAFITILCFAGLWVFAWIVAMAVSKVYPG